MLRILFVFFCLSSFANFSFAQNSTLNPSLVPEELIQAMQAVHRLAAKAQVNNIFMYRYVYYSGGFCLAQNCESEFVKGQIQAMKALLGNDFEELNKKYQAYFDEIRIAQNLASRKDLDNLISNRSASDILSRSVFTTCVDYAKAIASQAFANGMKAKDLKFFWTMGKDGYEKMCPKPNGQLAKLPRPLVHTILAYKYKSKWYAMNSENPNPEIIPLGKNLPARLSMNFIFSSPALVSGLPLTFAGAYDFSGFINGFSNQVILNIAASGIESAKPADFICR
jgi:hypothetical protein